MVSKIKFINKKTLPVILGAERAECGLASLAMVACYHGHEIDINYLRQRFSISITGASLRWLFKAGDDLGLGPRAIRAELESLQDIQLPAILHWDLNHFVVLQKVTPKYLIIHDPAIGAVKLSYTEASKHFTGVVLAFTPTHSIEKIQSKKRTKLSDLWSRIDGVWRAAIQVTILSIIMQVTIIAAPFYLQLTIDDVIASQDSNLLLVLALGFAILLLIRTAATFLRGWVITSIGFLISHQMVANLAKHLLNLPIKYFEQRHLGDVMSRLRSVYPIKDTITKGLAVAVIDGIMALLTAGILFFYSPKLAIIVLVFLFFSLVTTLLFYPAQRRLTEKQINAEAVASSHLIENIQSSTMIKVMGRELERHNSWLGLWTNQTNSTFSVEKYSLAMKAAQTLTAGLQVILIVYIAANMILNNQGFSVGMLFAFLSYRQTLTTSAETLINQSIEFKYLSLHLDRVGEIIHTAPEVFPGEYGVNSEGLGAIKVKGLSFRYSKSDPIILDDVNIEITPGDFVAITGPSGGGKTTFLKLMLGLYVPVEGEIELDGTPATPALFKSWREHIGVVLQDDSLLSGTIAENIAFSDFKIDMEKVKLAAEAAGVHKDIMSFPMQYLSLIGDMGSMLSGGQKQRVLLARALYRDPKILILDEGTANLDPETEEKIVSLVETLPITRIVIAHRPALIEKASQVFEIRDGKMRKIK